jgi:DUF3102 family protein
MADEQGEDAKVTKAFDYSVLEESKRVLVQTETSTIKMGLKRTAEGIVTVGQSLMRVKSVLEHGEFQEWLRAEFDLSYPTAVRFMQVGERFGSKNINLIGLPPSVLYELAAPSTTDEVVEKVLSGEISADLKSIREAKEAKRQPQKRKRKKRPGVDFPQLLLPGARGEQWRQKVLESCRTLVDDAEELLGYFSEMDLDEAQQEAILAASLEIVQGHEGLLHIARLVEEAFKPKSHEP